MKNILHPVSFIDIMGCERVRNWIWCRRNKRESFSQTFSGSYQEHGREAGIRHLSWWSSSKRRMAAWDRPGHWNRHCCIGYGRGWCKVWWARCIGKTIWIVWWRWGVAIKRGRKSWWYNGTGTRAGFWVVFQANRWRCGYFFSGKRWWRAWWLINSWWRRWESLYLAVLAVLGIEESLGFLWRENHESTRVWESMRR